MLIFYCRYDVTFFIFYKKIEQPDMQWFKFMVLNKNQIDDNLFIICGRGYLSQLMKDIKREDDRKKRTNRGVNFIDKHV